MLEIASRAYCNRDGARSLGAVLFCNAAGLSDAAKLDEHAADFAYAGAPVLLSLRCADLRRRFVAQITQKRSRCGLARPSMSADDGVDPRPSGGLCNHMGGGPTSCECWPDRDVVV
jgi:hypothetical protein